MSIFRMASLVLVLSLVGVPLVHGEGASSYEPVDGENFEGCASMAAGYPPYSPVPVFNISYPDGPVALWPEGTYDFCAMLDTIYCSLAPLKSLDERIGEFGGLLQCIQCDLNGPVNAGATIPLTGNGFLDGLCELSIVAAVLNNPEHPLFTEVTVKFQANVMAAKILLSEAMAQVPFEGEIVDLRDTIKQMTPHLPRALAAIFGAYGVLGDDQTYEALDALVDKLSILGMEPVEGGIRSLMEGVPALSLDGDANDDGFTNRQAYQYFVEVHGHDCAAFALLAADPDGAIRLADLQGGGSFLVGDSLMLTAEYDQLVVELPDGDNSFTWTKNGKAIADESGQYLHFPSLTVADSGVYAVSFPARVLLDGMKNDVEIFTIQTEVQVDWPVPLYQGFGKLLSVLLGLTFLYLFSRFLFVKVRAVI